jgi:hypothetical protein
MRRTRIALVATTLTALLLAGCGGNDSGTEDEPAGGATSETPASSPSEPESSETDDPDDADDGRDDKNDKDDKPLPQGPFADIELEGHEASPNGQRIKLGVGEKLTLRIESDRPGELHVHSTPEQEISFPAGESERRLVIEQPGVVDVEEHESGLVLLQLEVR